MQTKNKIIKRTYTKYQRKVHHLEAYHRRKHQNRDIKDWTITREDGMAVSSCEVIYVQ